jgi:hypothetical protein
MHSRSPPTRAPAHRPGDLCAQPVGHQPRRGRRADEHRDHDDRAHRVEGRHRGDCGHDHQPSPIARPAGPAPRQSPRRRSRSSASARTARSARRPAAQTAAMRGNSSAGPGQRGRVEQRAPAIGANQISDSRLPISACSTSRCTLDVSDCSSSSTPPANSVVKTTPIAAPGSIRPSRGSPRSGPPRPAPRPAAPSSIGSAATVPVIRKATTIPGSTTWLIASPISACRRRIRKLPGSAQAIAASTPIRIGGQRKLDEFGAHQARPPEGDRRPIRRSNSAISSAVNTASIGSARHSARSAPHPGGSARAPPSAVRRGRSLAAWARPASVATPSGRISPSARSRRSVKGSRIGSPAPAPAGPAAGAPGPGTAVAQQPRPRRAPGRKEQRQREQGSRDQHDDRPGRQGGRRGRNRRPEIARHPAEPAGDPDHRAAAVGPEPRGHRGMISSATIRISPTIFSPITVTPSPAPSSPDRSGAHRGRWRRHSRGRRPPASSAGAAARSPARQRAANGDHQASWRSMPAVEPSRNDSSPACRPAHGLDHGQQHDAEAEEGRQHRADGGILGSRVRRASHSTTQSPKRGRNRRAQQAGRQRPPVAAQRDHDHEGQPDAGQGGMGHASDTSARLRRNRKVPPRRRQSPASAAPMATRAAL